MNSGSTPREKSQTSTTSMTKVPNRKTKKQTAIQLLRRVRGASLAELEKRLAWQPHSVRGFLSGTARKLDGFDLVSQTSKSGKRRYRLIKQAA